MAESDNLLMKLQDLLAANIHPFLAVGGRSRSRDGVPGQFSPFPAGFAPFPAASEAVPVRFSGVPGPNT